MHANCGNKVWLITHIQGAKRQTRSSQPFFLRTHQDFQGGLMTTNRRTFWKTLAETAGAAGILALTPAKAHAYLAGIYWLACPYCDRIDRVDQATKQHVC